MHAFLWKHGVMTDLGGFLRFPGRVALRVLQDTVGLLVLVAFAILVYFTTLGDSGEEDEE